MGNVSDLWNLEADPATLDSLEDAWKSQVKQLSWAADTITSAANRVVGSEAWKGETAERYDQHRRKIVKDLDKCADLTGNVARALGECAQTLRHNQSQLTAERHKLNNIRSDNAGGTLTFRPKDPQEAKLVNEAIKAANEIRGRVDRELNAKAAVFKAALGQLTAWERAWSARTLKMLNWNVQQGGDGNKIWPRNDDKGTESRDIGDLAAQLRVNNVDVATLQEIFKDDAEKLEKALNDGAEPGEKWEVQFGKGSERWHQEDNGLFPFKGKDDFGNAIVVRTGNGVTTGPSAVTDLGPGDEPRSATRTQINIR
ncbi:hypothetical protein EV193_102212 [Herbihabitans rhizosphaerae]|uniref:Endonuclease/exonuclease/phosphatase domain-containing protein n=1 Tax=Herbihabitans rhizosphaerae TaxID=1872711 RepID=A0A4V2EU39_9PSEU|nr:endonuclease/exonuclease/phosphatase family protein [Herbihabitans rhizosphaerae]RZS43233.1 hypothetical protein EV193_102212 [Herbihabitans rhizosphaerae]